MSLRRIVVLDCGTSRLSVGVFGERKGTLCCESVSTAPVPPLTIETWPAAIAGAIGGIMATIPRRSRLVLILPSQSVILKQMRTPRVAPAKSRQVLEFAVAQSISPVAGELVWDAVSSGIYETEVDHLVVAVKVPVLAPILQGIRNAGLEIGAILPSILALQAAEPLSLPSTLARRLLIETGEWGTTFLQTDGARFAVRSLSSAAESGDGILRLAQEATRTLLHLNRQNGFEAPEQVILASEKIRDFEMHARIAEQLKHEVECPAPTVSVPLSADAAVAKEMTFARMVGGAVTGMNRARYTVNLVPAEIREREKLRRSRPRLIAAWVLAVSVLLPPIFVLRNESAVRRRQSIKLESILAPLQAAEKRMQALQTQIATLRQDGERLRLLVDRRTSWWGFLGALQDRLAAAEDVWLERLQTVAPEGGAPMKLVLRGCMLDRGSPPVAAKMRTLVGQLRTLSGVSAVEGERFDTGRPHVLKFELVLVIDPAHPL